MLFDWEALLSLYYVEQTYLSICLNACLSDVSIYFYYCINKNKIIALKKE